MNEVVFKKLKVNLDTKSCFLLEDEINLTKTEYNLLVFFLENKDKIYTRKEIMKSVWDSEVSLRAVDTTISRLRKKLKEMGKYIATKPGFGYWFNTK